LKIGVDAGTLRHTLTGIGWYLWQVLQELAKTADKDSIYLYAPRSLTICPHGKNIHLRTGRSYLPGSFWLQIQGRAVVRQDSLDCFWGPAHILPLDLPSSVRTVITVHDLVWLLYPETMARYNVFVHKFFFERSVCRANAIIADSEQTKRDLVTKLGVQESRVTVIHGGVEDMFRPIPSELVHSRLQGIGITGDYILSVGTLEPRKNYPLLFRAFAQLRKGLTLVVVGQKGWKYRNILQEIDRLGLQDRLRLLQYVPTEDLVTLYNGARFLVMPSIYEGFGLPILQAMACGTPVLASNCSSLPEVGGNTVVYFNPMSVESLTVKMSNLLTNESLRAEMRKKGLLRARQFTWQRTAKKTLTLLRDRPCPQGSPI